MRQLCSLLFVLTVLPGMLATAAFAHSLHWIEGFFPGRLSEIKIPIS